MCFEEGTPPLECGGESEYDNGNGSFMRILPILFHLQFIYGSEFNEIDEAYEIIHNISSLTHGHKRSQMACGIYISIASMLMGQVDLKTAVNMGVYRAMKYYEKHPDFFIELDYFERLTRKDFANIDEREIKSSGYVLHTLEDEIWCILNTDNYMDCVLKAVNLGEDTDTVAAVAGGLAGLYYGYGGIPVEWLDTIVRREYIEDLCNQLNESFLGQ